MMEKYFSWGNVHVILAMFTTDSSVFEIIHEYYFSTISKNNRNITFLAEGKVFVFFFIQSIDTKKNYSIEIYKIPYRGT